MRLPAVAFGIVALAACHRAEQVRFDNAPVVLISIDTLRADHLPAYGYTGVQTPNLDAFRRDSVLFRNAYSPCPMTLPSHVSMLTGLLPPQHGVRDNAGFHFDGATHPTLPRLLKERGYATGAAVSSFVLRGETGLAPLFDSYDDSIDVRPGAAFREYQRSGSITESVAEKWIDAHAANPFFYFFHIYEPHVPYDPPEPFRGIYANRYDGEIAAADAIVGKLLDHLKAKGIYDKAIVIVTSDHGEGLNDHGEDQHSILIYREAIHVPLLLKLPSSKRANSTVDAPAQLADAGYAMTEAADGADALALLDGGLRCDVLVSDLAMAGMDGVTLIRAAQRRRPGLPAILVTGYAGDAAALAVGQAVDGAFALLRKPVSGAALADRVAALLGAAHGEAARAG